MQSLHRLQISLLNILSARHIMSPAFVPNPLLFGIFEAITLGKYEDGGSIFRNEISLPQQKKNSFEMVFLEPCEYFGMSEISNARKIWREKCRKIL